MDIEKTCETCEDEWLCQYYKTEPPKEGTCKNWKMKHAIFEKTFNREEDPFPWTNLKGFE